MNKVARPKPSASAAKRPDDRRGWYGQIENRHSLKMVEMLKAVRKERLRQAKTTPPSTPAAQALVAGLLQGLGERYGDERLKAEGEELARATVKARSKAGRRP